jgi:hypothetical protein
MGIKKYTGYFHDGGFIGAKRKEDNVELFLQSCEISNEHDDDVNPLCSKLTFVHFEHNHFLSH